jgi:AcrR family transcriptional regulator
MTTRDLKRHDILRAAMELFAKNGFRGTTTRDLAAHAGVNEAIIFRHFHTKSDLYRAILEEKITQTRDATWAHLDQIAATTDPRTFLTTFGEMFLDKHEQDTTFMRLLMFSALEGHELADMFMAALAVRDPLASYLGMQMDAGKLRRSDATLAARAFLGMFLAFVQMQEIFGQKKANSFSRKQVVETFVSIFLNGMETR